MIMNLSTIIQAGLLTEERMDQGTEQAETDREQGNKLTSTSSSSIPSLLLVFFVLHDYQTSQGREILKLIMGSIRKSILVRLLLLTQRVSSLKIE